MTLKFMIMIFRMNVRKSHHLSLSDRAFMVLVKSLFIFHCAVFYGSRWEASVLITRDWFVQTKPRRDWACSNMRVNKVEVLAPFIDKRLLVLFWSGDMTHLWVSSVTLVRQIHQKNIGLTEIRNLYRISVRFTLLIWPFVFRHTLPVKSLESLTHSLYFYHILE